MVRNYRPGKSSESEFEFAKECLFHNPRLSEQEIESIQAATQENIREILSYSALDETDPPGTWMNDVHTLLGERLQLESYDQLRVRPFLAEGGAMDFLLLYTDRVTGKERRVTVAVDLTTLGRMRSMVKQKRWSQKVDVFISADQASPSPVFRQSEWTVHQSLGDEDIRIHQQELHFKEQVAELLSRVIQLKLERGDPNSFTREYTRRFF